jgi:hypothetical protein
MLHINTDMAAEAIKQQFSKLTTDKLNLGLARAINHTVAKAKSSSSRDLRAAYQIQSKYAKKALAVSKASRNSLEGKLMASGKPIPLMAFKPRQNKQGVSIRVKNSRKTIKSAFIATMPSGHKGVFARGMYTKDGFKFRTKRVKKTGPDTPITELNSQSVQGMYANKVIVNNLRTKIEDSFPKRFVHELTRLS